MTSPETSPGVSGNKSKGKPIVRTAKQQKAVEKVEAENDLAVQRTKAKSDAAQLAQVVNLVIAGHTFEDIAESIGSSAAEVETMVTNGAGRYVRTQPALRVWVRNWINAKYTEMIDANWDVASDPNHPDKLDNQHAVIKMLTGMERLHGAAAPTQSEVKVEHSHDAVELLVRRLSEQQGQGYDVSIFDDDDTVDAEVISDTDIHASADNALAALEAASRNVGLDQDDDGPLTTQESA